MHGHQQRTEVLHVETSAGQRMVTTIRGRGERAAVLLHGLPGCRADWNAVAGQLPQDRRLVIPDLLGFGDSDPLATGQHARHEAESVLRLLDAVRIASFDLVGHDFGGPTSIWIWRLARERVRTITLLATNAFPDTPIPGFLTLARVPGLGDALFRLLFGRAGLTMLWRQATGDRARYPLRDFREVLRSRTGVTSTRTILLHSLRNIEPLYTDVAAALPGISVPAAVIWGDRDPFFDRAQGERLASAIPGARFHLLEGCGHFVPRERPDAVARILTELWAAGEQGRPPHAAGD